MLTNKNCALKLVDEIILYYDAGSKKHKKENKSFANERTFRIFHVLVFVLLQEFVLMADICVVVLMADISTELLMVYFYSTIPK